MYVKIKQAKSILIKVMATPLVMLIKLKPLFFLEKVEEALQISNSW